MQLVPFTAALLALIPVAIVVSVDLQRLRAWKHQAPFEPSDFARAAETPHGEAAAAHEAPAVTLDGHHVMELEGAVAHRDADLTTGLALEGEALLLHSDLDSASEL